MTILLRSDLDDDFWFHNSGGEHSGKHCQDPKEVLALAKAAQTGLTIPHEELFDLMSNDGLCVAREYLHDGGVGSIVGYAIADRSNADNILLHEVYVRPEYRRRGVGGYLLGKLVQSAGFTFPNSEMSIHHTPSTAEYAGITYSLAGTHVLIYSRGNKDEFTQRINEFRKSIVDRERNILLEVSYEGDAEVDDRSRLTLFQKGRATELDRLDFEDEGVLLGVINHLNRQA